MPGEAAPEPDEATPEPDRDAPEPDAPEADGPALPPIPDALLAPLLDAAGETLRGLPPAELPPAARRLRSFDRRGLATPAARQQLRKLLEENEAVLAATVLRFRARPEVTVLARTWDDAIAAGGDAPASLVTEVAGEGRLPLLASVLTSGLPDCFEFGLGLVVAMASVAGREDAATDAVRAATAGQATAEEAARRADAARSAAEAEAARLDAALREERRARRDREQELVGASAGTEAARAELESALAGARQQVAEVDRRLAEADRRVAEAERRLAAAESRAADAERRAADAAGRAAAAEQRACQAETRAAFAEEEAARAPAESAARAPGDLVAQGDLVDRSVLDQIAHAAEDLAAGLRRLADGPTPAAPIPTDAPASAPSPARAPSPGRAPKSSRTPPPPPALKPRRRGSGARTGDGAPASTPRRRAPVRLPPGMLHDDPAAIEAMVRTRGVAVIVDGYNVSMLAWPDASAAEQRERLCDALSEFQLRFRCEVTVVFDGADVLGVRPLRRRNLRVVFSAAGQEADEVVVGEVMFRPDEVPVIVVSSDREVRAGAEAEGATVFTADTLLQLMRR